MAAKTKDRIVAIYHYENAFVAEKPAIEVVVVTGSSDVANDNPNTFDHFDLWDQAHNCLNEGHPFYPDVACGGLPTWEDVAIFLNIFADKKADPLTDEQKEAIHKEAVEVVLSDCQQFPEYLESVVEAFIHPMNLQDKLDQISTEPECQKQSLGFDPTTGEPYEEDA